MVNMAAARTFSLDVFMDILLSLEIRLSKTMVTSRAGRYRGLAKNTGQIVTLFALANLWLARRRLLPVLGEVRP
jgi:hypothetical protein